MAAVTEVRSLIEVSKEHLEIDTEYYVFVRDNPHVSGIFIGYETHDGVTFIRLRHELNDAIEYRLIDIGIQTMTYYRLNRVS